MECDDQKVVDHALKQGASRRAARPDGAGMRSIIFSALFLSIGATAALAAAGSPIGSAITVVNLVTADLEDSGNPRQLSSGDDVRQQELIEVDNDGRSEIQLNDQTKLALGPGSRLMLDRFVYDPELSGGAIVMNFVRGTFRFITGIAAKPAYVIRTPNASITVRGTIFDVYTVTPNETWLLLIEGGVQACTNSGRCIVNDQPGKLIRISDDDIDSPQSWANISKGKDIKFDDAFPFIVRPPDIDPDVIFTRTQIVGSIEQKDETRERSEEPRKTKSKRSDDDDYTPPRPRKVKRYRVEREYVRETRYDRPKRSRGGRIIKKGLKAGLAIGVGIGVGYGIAKALKKKHY